MSGYVCGGNCEPPESGWPKNWKRAGHVLCLTCRWALPVGNTHTETGYDRVCPCCGDGLLTPSTNEICYMTVRPPCPNPAAQLDLYRQAHKQNAIAAARVFLLLMKDISTYDQATTAAMRHLDTLYGDDLVKIKDIEEWLDGIDRDRSGLPPTG